MAHTIKIDGARIRAARHTAKMSAGELAQRAGLSANHVFVLERGEMDPKPETVRKLSRALRVSQRSLRAQ